MANLSDAQFLTINNANVAGEVSDLLNRSPLLARMDAARSSRGSSDEYLKITAAPPAGFRAANAGRVFGASTTVTVTAALQILDASFEVDQAQALAHNDGPDAYVSREAMLALQEAFFTAEQQVINGTGTGGDATGFDGINDTISTSGHAMAIDAGAASGCSSAYFIRSVDEEANPGMQFTLGLNGNIVIGETVSQKATEPADNTKALPVLFTPITGYTGLRYGNIRAAARIANLGASANTLTDDLFSKAWELFPTGEKPNLIVAARRDVGNLHRSRTATNATGAEADWPTMWQNVPIIEVESIPTNAAAV